MKNIKVVLSTLVVLSVLASVSFAAPVKIIIGTTNQLDIPFSGKLNPHAKVFLGNYLLNWTQAGKGADVYADLPGDITAGTYVLKMNGKKREVAVGPFNAEVGLTNNIEAEVTRANGQEAGLTNMITTLSNSTYRAFMAYKVTIGSTCTVPYLGSLLFSNLSTVDVATTWTTNEGASFVIPKDGSYQINLAADITFNPNNIYQLDIINTPANADPAYSISSNYWVGSGAHTAYVLLSLKQGDVISVQNLSPYSDELTLWSASLSIVQVQ